MADQMSVPSGQADMPTDAPALPEALRGRVVDSHCHLDMCESDGGPTPKTSVELAKSVGVERIVQVGTDVRGSRLSVRLAEELASVSAAVALHPNEAPAIQAQAGLPLLEAAWREITELARHPEVVGIGETGMDFFRTEPAGRAVQEESFRVHIQLAKDLNKTLIIHDRDAHADVLRIMDDAGHPQRVILHCFSGDADFAREAAERGWYCSFAGVITFKNAQATREAAAVVPPELTLVETDAPFLTPVPNRGKRNGSYLMPATVRALADVQDLSETQMCEILWENSHRAFANFGAANANPASANADRG